MKLGVLALQGDFLEHVEMLRRLGAEAVEVRTSADMAGLSGLILPGGESTTIGKLAVAYGLVDPIRALAQAGRPVWGTCAGMILLARRALDGAPGQPLLGLLDIVVVRNGFGRQVDSFEADLTIPRLGPEPFRGVFIRAPYVQEWGAEVEVLARLEDGPVVAVQQGRILGTAFHPELTATAFHSEQPADERFHRYFLDLAR